ncbi:hypothetical protein ACIPSX_08465 [Pectobacterium sp. CHL-2024]|uniref:hypothetical protein n=1 Tax=Pectobacterium TaxID=122277 RepID=UPI001F101F83|nr:hypothetical protein [Pectobacterium carotovorum]MCH4996168.1 hypothetical protein [Pectobacterium carotovorum]
MSAAAQAVWHWITMMGMTSGDYVDARPFAAWCAKQNCRAPADFIPALDELVSLGYLVNRDEPDAEPTWNYWIA